MKVKVKSEAVFGPLNFFIFGYVKGRFSRKIEGEFEFLYKRFPLKFFCSCEVNE